MGASPAIIDPLSYPDHIIREVQAESPLGVEIPLRVETIVSLDWLSTAPPEVVAEFWEARLGELNQLVVPSKGHGWFGAIRFLGPSRRLGGTPKPLHYIN